MIRAEDARMREEMLTQVRMLTKSINWALVQTLTGAEADLASGEYLRIKEQLSMVRSVHPRCRFIYLIGQRRDGTIFFFADSESPDSRDYSPPGQVYEEAPYSFRQVFSTGKESVVGPYSDRWGTWISALAPLTVPQNEKLIAVVGMDIDAHNWNRKIFIYALTPVVTTLLFAVLFIFFFVLQWRTEREKQRIADSEKVLHELKIAVEQSMDGIAFVDMGGYIRFVNGAWARMHGYSVDELTGRHLSIFHTAEQLETDVIPFNQHALETGSTEGEVGHVRKDGTPFPTWMTSSVVRFAADQKSSGLLGIARDITERKQAENSIREWKNRYELIVAASGQVAYDYDIRTKSILWGQTMEKVIGYSPDEYGGGIDQWIDWLHPDDREATLRLLGAAEAACAYWDTEYRLRHKRGQYVWIRDRGFFIPDATGKASRQLGMLENITGRKQAEAELLRLAAAIDQAAENIVITDEKGIIQYINAATWNSTRVPREKIIGQSLFFPSQRNSETKESLESIWRTVSSGRIWKGRLQNRTHDGSVMLLDAVITPIKNAAGEIINYVSVSRDMTREVQLEQQLLQSQKMEAIGTLAGGIAHDFNNILGGILGFAEIAKDEVPEGSQSEYYLDQILKLGDRAVNLVRQILTFSRKTVSERNPIQLSPLITEVLNLLRATIPSTIEIRQKLQDEGSMVKADPTQIHQVLMNLCTNAAHAMQAKGGVLEIELERVNLTGEDITPYQEIKPGPYMRLRVSDTGTGIDPAIIDRIFDPFFTTKPVERGTGMGLAVVHGIIKNYKGDITVSSEPGKGTTFLILLPEVPSPAESEQKESNTVSLSGNEHILLIDDEESILFPTKKLLEKSGYKITTALSSIEALELFRSAPDSFNLVITDQTMPHITGTMLAREMLKIRPDIPIILSSGYSDPADDENIKGTGIKAYLMKPFKKLELGKSIREILDQ